MVCSAMLSIANITAMPPRQQAQWRENGEDEICISNVGKHTSNGRALPSPLWLGGSTRRANQTAAPLHFVQLWSLLLVISLATRGVQSKHCLIPVLYQQRGLIQRMLLLISSASLPQPVASPNTLPTKLFSCHQDAWGWGLPKFIVSPWLRLRLECHFAGQGRGVCKEGLLKEITKKETVQREIPLVAFVQGSRNKLLLRYEQTNLSSSCPTYGTLSLYVRCDDVGDSRTYGVLGFGQGCCSPAAHGRARVTRVMS